jgi:hypothetical protein
VGQEVRDRFFGADIKISGGQQTLEQEIHHQGERQSRDILGEFGPERKG